mmetsp:Transcript_50636/g.162066  ORF Transcript_50636/g.162066 Transcript_50636/m.162066 type:complete len:201 (+) Transcript_50636:2609-3211(+)
MEASRLTSSQAARLTPRPSHALAYFLRRPLSTFSGSASALALGRCDRKLANPPPERTPSLRTTVAFCLVPAAWLRSTTVTSPSSPFLYPTSRSSALTVASWMSTLGSSAEIFSLRSWIAAAGSPPGASATAPRLSHESPPALRASRSYISLSSRARSRSSGSELSTTLPACPKPPRLTVLFLTLSVSTSAIPLFLAETPR